MSGTGISYLPDAILDDATYMRVVVNGEGRRTTLGQIIGYVSGRTLEEIERSNSKLPGKSAAENIATRLRAIAGDLESGRVNAEELNWSVEQKAGHVIREYRITTSERPL